MSKKNVLLGEKVSAGLSNLQFKSPDEICDENLSVQKKYLSISDCGRKNFWISMEKVWTRCGNHILILQGTFRGNWLFGSVFRFFLQISVWEWKEVGPVATNLQQGCRNCILRVQDDGLRWDVFYDPMIF